MLTQEIYMYTYENVA